MQTLEKKLSPIILLDNILKQDGFVGFIQGRRDQGKTDFSLWLAQRCYEKGYRLHIATNIKTESYMVEDQITNVPDLNTWLQGSGKKLFILDEAGKHLRRMGFMSKKNQAIMDAVQLIRHFDGGLICIAPAQRFIDSGLLDTDVIDFIIKKVSRQYAKAFLMGSRRFIKLINVPGTSIKFNSKDIAEFTLEKKVNFQGLPLCCQVAALYAEHGSYDIVKQRLKLQDEQVRRKLREHCAHSTTHNTQPTERKV